MGAILDPRTSPTRCRDSRTLGNGDFLFGTSCTDAPYRLVALATDNLCGLDDARNRYHWRPLFGFVFDSISLYGCYPCNPSVLPNSYLECPTRTGVVKGIHNQGPHTGYYSWDSGASSNPKPRSRSSTTQESRRLDGAHLRTNLGRICQRNAS